MKRIKKWDEEDEDNEKDAEDEKEEDDKEYEEEKGEYFLININMISLASPHKLLL